MDEYTAEAYLYHQKFRIAPNKMVGWKRLVGQEVPVEAYSDLMAIAGSSSYGVGAADLRDVNGNVAAGSAVSNSVSARKYSQVVNGPQTPKAIQPALDLWIPLTYQGVKV